jgi:hypothetical protein
LSATGANCDADVTVLRDCGVLIPDGAERQKRQVRGLDVTRPGALRFDSQSIPMLGYIRAALHSEVASARLAAWRCAAIAASGYAPRQTAQITTATGPTTAAGQERSRTYRTRTWNPRHTLGKQAAPRRER